MKKKKQKRILSIFCKCFCDDYDISKANEMQKQSLLSLFYFCSEAFFLWKDTRNKKTMFVKLWTAMITMIKGGEKWKS